MHDLTGLGGGYGLRLSLHACRSAAVYAKVLGEAVRPPREGRGQAA